MSRVNQDQNQGQDQDEQQGEQTFNSDEGHPQQQTSGGWVLDGPDDLDDTFVPGQDKQQQQPPPAVVPTQGQSGQQYELRTKTGFVFRGATPEEALEQAQAHIDKISSTLGTSQYEGQQSPAPTQHRERQQHEPDVRWNDEEFFKTFAKDPHTAMGMFIESYFGDDPRQALSRSYSVAVQVSDRIAIADFLSANIDFPASPEAGALVIKRLEADNVDLTAVNLEVAFRKLVREGVLAPIQQQSQDQGQGQDQGRGRQQQQGDGRQIPPIRGRNAPPNVPTQQRSDGGDGNQVGDRELSLAEFENLSSVDMRRYMQRRAQITGRR